jgi:hypothetical protein
MIWLAKPFGMTEWFGVQDQFERLFMSMGGPRGMMLVSTDDAGTAERTTTLYMCLPAAHLAALFPGFSETTTLPAHPDFLVGNQAEMEAQFPR